MGNLDSKRDWGHAKDYIEMQWMMLQQQEPSDFIIATGEQHSVRDFVNIAAVELGMEITWQGSGVDEVGLLSVSGTTTKTVVRVDSDHFRPTDVETLLGDFQKAKNELGWYPKISFRDLIKEMVVTDLMEAEKDHLCRNNGFSTFNYYE